MFRSKGGFGFDLRGARKLALAQTSGYKKKGGLVSCTKGLICML